MAMVTGPGATAIEDEDEDATPALAFFRRRGAVLHSTAWLCADKEAPFTWTANPAINGAVENTAGKAMGKNEHWLINSGDIKDDGGLLVTGEFRGDEEGEARPALLRLQGANLPHRQRRHRRRGEGNLPPSRWDHGRGR